MSGKFSKAALVPNRLLMVAYHFPPLAGSSGIQRALRLAQNLPKFGWQPLVVTANPIAYERTSDDMLPDIPPDAVVRRAFALDTARHLSIRGRYVGAMARPDRWVSWKFDAVRQGMKLIEQFRPRAIWSTYPIATAHVIGAELHKRSGLPWFADFRDPMAQDGYPSDPATWKQFSAIESHALAKACLCTFTTPGAAREYVRRYPAAAARVSLLENGYDEESFVVAGAEPTRQAPLNPGCLTLLHSGVVYPSERDPTQVMLALQALHLGGSAKPGRLKLRFRASAHDELILSLAATYGVTEFVEVLPPVGYRDALLEMLRADVLLVMQASNCNDQIPAKVYEYLRSGRPVVAFADPVGDTADMLRRSGISAVVPLNDASAIAQQLQKLLDGDFQGTTADPSAIQAASRLGRTESFVKNISDALGLQDDKRPSSQGT